MKITKPFAKKFADAWVNAWNTRDIEAIMRHYADDVVFSSPFILKAWINTEGTIHGKTELKKYFEGALSKNPDLHFDLRHIMVGIKSITLLYNRNRSMLASEVMVLNEEGMVVEGLSHYPVDEIYELP